MRKYTESHEWIELSPDGIATAGLTGHAVEALGDIVFLELPEPGKAVKRGDPVAVVESVKAVSEIYAPVSGTIAAVNEALAAKPETLNREPGTWLLRIAPSDLSELDALMTEDAYESLTH